MEMMLQALLPKSKGLKILEDPEIFIIDTGAMQHSTGHGTGLIKLRNTKDSATRVGNGQIVKAKAIGKLPFVTSDGIKGTMGNVQLIPGLPFNLISGTKLQDLGFKVHGKGSAMEYTKNGISLKFDIRINTPKGMVLATCLKRTTTEVGGASTSTTDKTVSLNVAHKQLGRLSEDATRKVAKQLGWTLTKESFHEDDTKVDGIGEITEDKTNPTGSRTQSRQTVHGPTRRIEEIDLSMRNNGCWCRHRRWI